MPEFQVNVVAIALAVVANFFLGYVWYSLLFQKSWAQQMGFDPRDKPEKNAMLKGMSLSVLGSILLAWVLAHNIAAWNPLSWGLPPDDIPAIARAGLAAVFTWIGFYVPVLLNTVAWEKKSWTLFSINASYHLLSLLIVATIVVYM